MTKFIAERRLLYSVKGSNIRKEFIIRIGMPYRVRNWNGSPVEEGMFGCLVEYVGLDEPSRDVYGGDTLQALQLASNIDPYLKILHKKYDFFYGDDPYFDSLATRSE
jgi:hypothetical protein